MLTPVGEPIDVGPPSSDGGRPYSPGGRPLSEDGVPLVQGRLFPLSHDDLDPDSVRVLDTFPVRAAIGPSTIAAKAGVDIETVIRCLGLLAGAGFIEHCEQGWRLARNPSGS